MATATWIDELANAPIRFTSESDDDDLSRCRGEALRAFEKSLPLLYRNARLDGSLAGDRVQLPIPCELPTAKSVVFMGPPGIGKTTLAVAMLRAMLERELDTTTLVSEGDVTSIQRRYRFVHAHRLGVARINGPEGLAEITASTHAPLLLIDDLGKDAEIPSNAVSDVIQERHAEERVTWFTTSFDAKEIAARYGGGTARRILEKADIVRSAKSCSTERLRQ